MKTSTKVTADTAQAVAADAGASQEARRATEDSPASAAGGPSNASTSDHSHPDMQVVARAKRRQFSSAERQRILQAADRCTQPGEIGALLRREGIYSSILSTWRSQRKAAELTALAAQKRGPKPDLQRADAQRIAQLSRDNARLQSQLDKALLVIDVQKKVSVLLGLTIPHTGVGSI